MRDAIAHYDARESGIVEADETLFLESFKGPRKIQRPSRKHGGASKTRGTGLDQIPVLIVRGREAHAADFQLEKLEAAHVTAALGPLMDEASVLCTYGAVAYAAFARHTGITHKVVYARPALRAQEAAFHIQNINAHHSRLKSWMVHFHSVTTKYLVNYLGWRRMLERYTKHIQPVPCLQEAVGRPMQQLTGT